MTKELKQEYTLRITQANKTQLAVILYEMTITYLEEASRLMTRGIPHLLRTVSGRQGDASRS